MQRTLTYYFVNSAGFLLLVLALAMFVSNGASTAFPRDPIFMISMRNLFWIVGAIGLAVAIICLFGSQEQNRLKITLVLWLAANFLVYQIMLSWTGVYHPVVYLGNLAHTFGLATGTVKTFMAALILYLLIGGSALLILSCLGKPSVAETAGWLKIPCPSCGGKIKFPEGRVGEQTICPHCQSAIILQETTDLKMSCVLCGGHIVFPAYALGQKISCPHCRKDITLKILA